MKEFPVPKGWGGLAQSTFLVLVAILLLTLVGFLSIGCTPPSQDELGQFGSPHSVTTTASTPQSAPTPSDTDLCVQNPECRLEIEGDEIRNILGLSSFNFDMKSVTGFDGYQYYSGWSDPAAVVVEWLEIEGVVSIHIAGPEPAVILELGYGFIRHWDSLVRFIASGAVPSPWNMDLVGWIMNTYSGSKTVNGVLIEIDYFSELGIWSVKFQKTL